MKQSLIKNETNITKNKFMVRTAQFIFLVHECSTYHFEQYHFSTPKHCQDGQRISPQFSQLQQI